MSTLWSTDVDCYDSVLSYIFDINSDVYWVRRFCHCFKTSREFGLLEFINDNCERYKNLLQMLSRKKPFLVITRWYCCQQLVHFDTSHQLKKICPFLCFLTLSSLISIHKVWRHNYCEFTILYIPFCVNYFVKLG